MEQISKGLAAFLVIVAMFSGKNRVESLHGKRPYYYARLSNDLRDLARRDFETKVKLERFTDHRKEVEQLPPLSKIANNYLEDFANSTDGSTASNVVLYVEEAVRNPIAMFRVIHRVAHFFAEDSVTDIPDLPVTDLKKELGNNKFALRNDLVDAADGILRIHFMYNLNATELAAGKIRGVETSGRLLAVHCLYIGLVAKFRKQYTLAVEWLREAKRLATVERRTLQDIPTVQAELIDTIKEHDRLRDFQGFSNPNFFMTDIHSLHSTDGENPKVKDVLQSTYAGKGRNSSYWPMNVWALCSSENLQTPGISAQLFCWREFKVNKMFTIGPLNMEFLSRNPDIVHIHDAFRSDDLNKLIVGADPPDHSKFAHVTQNRIDRMWNAMTGLVSSDGAATDEDRGTNYIPGGHQEIHIDSEADTHSGGDRIATFAVYLNEVEDGGYTAFPAASATAIPSKGSAIFWFNALSDGTPDFSTAHAECPVVLGEKLVFSKWIPFHDQFLTRKCLLTAKKRFQVPVNGKLLPVHAALHHKLITEPEYDDPESLSVDSEASIEDQDWNVPIVKYSYCSVRRLKSLVRLDWEIYQNVRRMVTEIEITEDRTLDQDDEFAEKESIRRYLQQFNQTGYNSISAGKNVADLEVVTRLAWNPLAVYSALWRFENFIKRWTRETSNPGGKYLRRIREYLGQVYNVTDGPSKKDLNFATVGVLNIQFVHDLKSDEIAQGFVAGIDTGIVLTAKQCIEIGHLAIATDYYYQAIDWMATAVHKVISEADATVSLAQAQMELETAKIVHDKLLEKLDASAPTFFLSPVSAATDLNGLKTRKQIMYDKYRLRNEKQFADINYRGLCQGKLHHQTVTEISKLFCWYEMEIHPYYKIGPVKTELLSMHPKAEIVQYHDVLGDQLGTYLRNGTSWEYVTSTIAGKTQSSPTVRLSASAYLAWNGSAESMSISKLIKRVTGMNVVGQQDMKLVMNSYSPGGHYKAHRDTIDYDVDGEHTLIATFMFYLSDVKEGGGTAFSQCGVNVTPEKGSAIVWHNVHSSGAQDESTFHGACPVIYGEKLVATKPIMYVDQHHLQCDRDPRRKLEFLVNGKSKYGYS